MKNFNKAFSLIELIFTILIIAIITSVAAPNLFSFTSKATITTVTQDIKTIISSVQNYYAMKGEINKITDAVKINTKNWDINDTIVTYNENGSECVKIFLSSSNTLDITITPSSGTICQEIANSGIITETIDLIK